MPGRGRGLDEASGGVGHGNGRRGRSHSEVGRAASGADEATERRTGPAASQGGRGEWGEHRAVVGATVVASGTEPGRGADAVSRGRDMG